MDGKSCSQCGRPLHQRICVNGVTKYRRCADRKCHHREYVKSGSILEASNLIAKKFLYLCFFWSHNCGGERAQKMLHLGPQAASEWSERFRVCVKNAVEARENPFGGPWFC